MNVIEKIRAEIERQKEGIGLGLNEYDTGFENGKCEICNHILSFLDTIEEPVVRPSWKPSENQMKALKRCVDGWTDDGDGALDSLYNDLKKLM